MNRSRWVRVAGTLLLASIATFAFGSNYTATVVNVVPAGPLTERESERNPEPSIAVNPVDPSTIAVSAFQLNQRLGCYSGDGWVESDDCGVCPSHLSGVLLSTDAGKTFEPRCFVPLGEPGETKLGEAGDMSIEFSGDGTRLYVAHRAYAGEHRFELGYITDFSSVEPAYTSLTKDAVTTNGDMPFLATLPEKGRRAAFVGVRHSGISPYPAPNCLTGFLWVWTDADARHAECVSTRLSGTGFGTVDAVRVAVSPAGDVYTVSYTPTGPDHFRDVVITRGLAGSTSGATTAINEAGATIDPGCKPGDAALAGVRVACNVAVDYYGRVGWERVSEHTLAVAVDPGNADRIYVAYGEQTPGGNAFTLHLGRSDVGGKAPLIAMRTIADAVNPVLAVAPSGRVGVLYQRFVQVDSAFRWQAILDVMKSDGTLIKSLQLAETPAFEPGSESEVPYLGDYLDLAVVGEDFHGVFAANNHPGWNPNAEYQRPTVPESGIGRRLPTDTPVSVDPFYFHVHYSRSWGTQGMRIAAMALSSRAASVRDWFKRLNRPPFELPASPTPSPGPGARTSPPASPR